MGSRESIRQLHSTPTNVQMFDKIFHGSKDQEERYKDNGLRGRW